MSWRLMRPVVLKRGPTRAHVVRTWVVQEGYPPFPTRRDAIRHFIEGMEPAMKGVAYEHIRRHWETPLYRDMVRVEWV